LILQLSIYFFLQFSVYFNREPNSFDTSHHQLCTILVGNPSLSIMASRKRPLNAVIRFHHVKLNCTHISLFLFIVCTHSKATRALYVMRRRNIKALYSLLITSSRSSFMRLAIILARILYSKTVHKEYADIGLWTGVRTLRVSTIAMSFKDRDNIVARRSLVSLENPRREGVNT
jgi:hypothetical protein